MKLKRVPEDFQVEELPTVSPARQGRFTFYRLFKRGLGTPEALEAVRRRWNLAASQISHGGMKDRHASTIQYITVYDGLYQSQHQTNLDLEPIGYLPHPYTSAHFRGNRFAIVLRDLSAQAARHIEAACAPVEELGLPNYFDDQRFGSVGESGDFAAEAWIKGDFERALWLAIAEHNPHDRPEGREEKDIVRELWPRWSEAKERLPRSHTRSIITYLVDHPDDFRGAFVRLNRTWRSLAFSAFQSHLWNIVLGKLLGNLARPDQIHWFEFESARLPIALALDPTQRDEFASWILPLPSARAPAPPGPLGDLTASLLDERGYDWKALRVKHMKDLFFSKGTRPARFAPQNLKWREEADELYPGRKKMSLNFELGKGSYATIVVKRIML